jgi:hypothetical protein
VVADLERLAPVLLCKLEKIFPPSFFNPMQHLILHLPYEAQMGGGVQGRWCYAIERCLKTIRKKCRNKCKIEASIAEAYILEVVSNFTTTYYGDKLPSVHNPPPLVTMMVTMNRTLAYFEANSEAQVARHEEWRHIMLYVLTNLEEVTPYLEQFLHEFWRRSRDPTPQEYDTLLRKGCEKWLNRFHFLVQT